MSRQTIVVLAVVLMAMALLGVQAALRDERYVLISTALVITALFPFFVRFERNRWQTRELVLISLLAALAAVSRIPFAGIPSVQPTSFVIIMTALAFGAEIGFLVGALAAFLSNMLIGQGPWTPWQMFGWGMLGLVAGLLRNTRWMNRRIGLLVFGALAGFLFGWLMNVPALLAIWGSIDRANIVAAFAASFYFDIAHALGNVFFLAVFATVWMKTLDRIRVKYGILDRW